MLKKQLATRTSLLHQLGTVDKLIADIKASQPGPCIRKKYKHLGFKYSKSVNSKLLKELKTYFKKPSSDTILIECKNIKNDDIHCFLIFTEDQQSLQAKRMIVYLNIENENRKYEDSLIDKIADYFNDYQFNLFFIKKKIRF
tara:strand:+ start:818 stop:1243 length:426 start_codon:yes stop_codon:yes gene_type:complete